MSTGMLPTRSSSAVAVLATTALAAVTLFLAAVPTGAQENAREASPAQLPGLTGVADHLPTGDAEAAGDERRAMTLVDLISMPSLSDPRLSPDGERLLYVLGETDWDGNRTVTHVWMTDVEGTDVRRLTTSDRGESSPRWSPDGRWIAFLSDRDGDEDGDRITQLWIMRSDGGEARRLTDHPTSVSSISWSPDGRWIYFLAEDEKREGQAAREEKGYDVFAFDEDWRHRHVWRVNAAEPGEDPVRDGGAAATREAERVTRGEFTVLNYELSRDGRHVVHHRAPSPLFDDILESDVWIMARDGSDARRVTDRRVPESGARLSPDGDTVLFTCFCNREEEFYFSRRMFLVPARGGDARVLLPGMDHEVDAARWSADGGAVYFLANTGVRRDLYRVDLETEEVTGLTRGDHALGNWRYEPEPGLHVFTVDRPDNRGDVWILDEEAARDGPVVVGTGREGEIREGEAEGFREHAGAGLTRVTGVFDYLADRFRLPRQDTVWWRGEDGTEVEGLLFWPLDYREGDRHPLVVQTHGGPPTSDKFGFGSPRNYPHVLTAMGYFVFQPNYRGSTGYGDDFLRDMVPGYFDQSHLDVMTGVDALVERGWVDGDRMAKMGWSAGGHMTNKIITHTDRFRAASSGAGAVNWISMYGTSDVRIYRTPWFGGTPWQEDAPVDVYWEHSPLSEIHRATTPTLVLVGENDERVPKSQSVELFRALRSLGVPTHLYVAPRTGHGWRELRHRLFKSNVELEWFERWVRDRDYEWEVAPGDEPDEAVTSSEQVREFRGGG